MQKKQEICKWEKKDDYALRNDKTAEKLINRGFQDDTELTSNGIVMEKLINNIRITL